VLKSDDPWVTDREPKPMADEIRGPNAKSTHRNQCLIIAFGPVAVQMYSRSCVLPWVTDHLCDDCLSSFKSTTSQNHTQEETRLVPLFNMDIGGKKRLPEVISDVDSHG
jgi:hypothetical protein